MNDNGAARESGARKRWRRLVVVLSAAAVAFASAVAAAPAASAEQPTGRGYLFDQQLLYLVNHARQQAGVPVLHSDAGLAYLASFWSYAEAHGATGGNLMHNPRATAMLSQVGAGNWQDWSENIAVFKTSDSPKQVFDLYMASPAHRANILDPAARYFGSGSVAKPDDTAVFNTMEFTDRVEPGGCHPLPDVDATIVHCSNIAWLSKQGITNPADGNYHPYRPVNRGAMAAFLFRMTHPGKASPVCHSKPFPDVPVANVFCGYIQWAKDAGVAAGYPNGDYGPSRPVTRGAMAAYLHRIVTGKGATPCRSKPFEDVSVSDTFCGVITWAKTAGVTYGVGDGSKYGPELPVTRQSMASFLHRVSKLV